MEALITDLGNRMLKRKTVDVEDHIAVIKRCFNVTTDKVRSMVKSNSSTDLIKQKVLYYQLEISTLLSKVDLLMSSIDRRTSPAELTRDCKKVLWAIVDQAAKFIDFLRTFLYSF